MSQCLGLGVKETHQNYHSEGTGGQQQVDPGLDLVGLHVESWRDDAGFIETSVQLDDDFSRAMVIDDLKVANVACPRPMVSEGKRRGQYVSIP